MFGYLSLTCPHCYHDIRSNDHKYNCHCHRCHQIVSSDGHACPVQPVPQPIYNPSQRLRSPPQPPPSLSETKFAREAVYNRQHLPKFVARYGDPRWQPDTSHCSRCRKEFGLFLWPHHCRLCGKVVCDDCSKGRLQEQRVCDHCQPT
jgi:hypothetical protein